MTILIRRKNWRRRQKDWAAAVDKIFSENGILARAVKGYRPRAGQIAMARAVAEHSGKQILEAGTGIGKTFAYLAPILCNGLSAVISTGTRALQDQLYLRDLPFLIKTLQTPARVAMLKGRANYLCRRNLADPQQSQLFRGGGGDWARVLEYAKNTEEGDIRGATDIAADSPIWTAAVSARETCPAQGCEHYEKCFLYRARARAKAADIVIVNHYLFLADMRLREEEVAELLPARDL
ncbi:MAG: ATP-dependent DNA helicase, partial [Betaproteobacteria bacterium]|nr:ATP-dependent DNA helicase [Betaproteobacteria bacterium]